jgi:hypothetical protein
MTPDEIAQCELFDHIVFVMHYTKLSNGARLQSFRLFNEHNYISEGQQVPFYRFLFSQHRTPIEVTWLGARFNSYHAVEDPNWRETIPSTYLDVGEKIVPTVFNLRLKWYIDQYLNNVAVDSRKAPTGAYSDFIKNLE